MTARFRPGRLVATPAALAAMDKAAVQPVVLIARHLSGDWGDLEDEDKAANELALLDGGRLLSSYALAPGISVWVITEAVGEDDRRECTTILLPSDY